MRVLLLNYEYPLMAAAPAWPAKRSRERWRVAA